METRNSFIQVDETRIDDPNYPALEEHFYNHLKTAFLRPETFSFDGFQCKYHGRIGAEEFIRFHEDRMNVKFDGVVSLIVDDEIEDSFNVPPSSAKIKILTYDAPATFSKFEVPTDGRTYILHKLNINGEDFYYVFDFFGWPVTGELEQKVIATYHKLKK